MEDYPKNIMEFERRFNSEKSCREYLFNLRWADGFICPRCQHNEAWTAEKLYKCKNCGFKTSIIVGTIFQDSKRPLQLWFRAIWYVTTQKYGTNAIGIQRILGLGSYHTAWIWLHKLRHVMVRPGRERLSGIIDIDEVYIGGEKSGKRGRGAEGKTLIFVAVENKNSRIGRIRLKQIFDTSAQSLEPSIKESVEPGSIINTDGWIGYSGVGKIGYIHEVVRNR